MSELINNRERRREALKDIILQLHQGRDPQELKAQFHQLLQTAGATEIAELETELIAAGLPEEEVRRLCDVHVAIFEDALEAQAQPETVPGHPVHTFRLENEAAAQVVEEARQDLRRLGAAGGDYVQAEAPLRDLREHLLQLRELDKHYTRKENLLFPYLEKYGIKGPSAVMWGLHDEIRAGLKEVLSILDDAGSYTLESQVDALRSRLNPLLEMITSMFQKEDNILFPMSLERLSEEEWLAIHRESPDIGFALVEPGDEWPIDLDRLTAEQERAPARAEPAPKEDGLIRLETGVLSGRELNLLLKHLPVDITFVDKDDRVRYFSAGRDRIFVRTEAVIGRAVQNCHPPSSVHIVNRILGDFKSGRRDDAEFWINFEGRLVHIRYFAVRDEEGEYAGTLEVTQDVTAIRELEGERRLLSEAEAA